MVDAFFIQLDQKLRRDILKPHQDAVPHWSSGTPVGSQLILQFSKDVLCRGQLRTVRRQQHQFDNDPCERVDDEGRRVEFQTY